MSDTQVTIGFGGTTSDFEAACQRAQQALSGLVAQVNSFTTDLKSATAGLNQTTPAMSAAAQSASTAAAAMSGAAKETRGAADAAKVLSQAASEQTSSVTALHGSMDATTAAAGRAAHASGGLTREILVLGHEAMMGNFSRFGGSLIVMAELMGNISVKTIAAGGAIALAGIAAYHLYENLKQATDQARALYNQMALMGRDPELVTAKAKTLATELQTMGSVGSRAARDIAAEFMSLPGTTDELRAKLAALVPALQAATDDEPVEKVASSFAKTARTVAGIQRFFEENDLFGNAQQREAIAGFERTNNLAGAQALLVQRVNERYAEQYDRIIKLNKEAKDNAQTGYDAPFLAAALTAAPPPQKVKMTEQARSPEDAQLDEQQARLNAERGREVELDQTIAGLRARLAQTSDEAAKKDVENALSAAEAERASLREKGDTSWFNRQEDALSRQNVAITASAKTARDATEAKLSNEIAYWNKVLTATDLSVAQRTQAERRLSAAQISLNEERLRAKEAADRAGTLSAKKSTQEQIAELSAEQAANKDDFTKWMAIEQEKLGVLRSAYGVMSTQFQNELRAEETYQREHEAKLLTIELQRIEAENQLGEKKLAGTVQALSAEAAAVLITKSDELAASRDATIAEGNLELKRLDDFITTLHKGTAELDKALKQRETLYQTFANKVAAIDTRIAAQDKQAADRSTQAFSSAFSQIGSTGERMFTGLITGTTTWQKAEQQAASAVLQSVVSLAGQALARWAAYEVGKTVWTQGQTAIRAAQEKGETGMNVIAQALANWIGLETGKTAVTGAQTTLRKTDETGADAAAAVLAAATALAEVKASAAAAGAAAYASTAAIPVTGPGLAPEAAATAYAGAMSFAAGLAVPGFAVGAWNLPSDMLAMVHAGEMIVPSFQADAMRNGASLGGGGAPSITINASAMDGPGMMAALRQVVPQLAKALQSHYALNPSVAP